jgi:transketolase
MRAAFAKTLTELADTDPRIMLITADLGYMALEPFAEKHPARFVNVGVAEQNMVGLATGLAEAGFIPFLYSIVTFASMRAYEFIRNGPVLHQLPVRIVGVGGGFEYGTAGPTHFGLEDVGLMRLQPDLRVIVPADHQQTRSALLQTWDQPGPTYYRLGKDDKTVVPGLDGRFERERLAIVRQGENLLFVTMGAIASEVVRAAEGLSRRGIESTVAVVSTLNPSPQVDLAALLRRFPLVLTVEAHYLTGGVGSLVAEVIADNGLGCRTFRCGVNRSPNWLSGSQGYHHRAYGLDQESLQEAAVKCVRQLTRV